MDNTQQTKLLSLGLRQDQTCEGMYLGSTALRYESPCVLSLCICCLVAGEDSPGCSKKLQVQVRTHLNKLTSTVENTISVLCLEERRIFSGRYMQCHSQETIVLAYIR